MSDVMGLTGQPILFKRLFKLKCPCEHEFIIDLGVKWAPNKIIRCPECKNILGGTSIVLEGYDNCPLIFPKRFGRCLYEIPDPEAYRRYWIGKRPSTRKVYEEWLNDPDASMYEVSKRHGKQSWAIQVHTTAMGKLGILIRRRRPH